MHIFFLGYPGAMGGANTECWHTAKVWRQHGIEVTFIPTWQPGAMLPRLEAIGCKTVVAGGPDGLRDVPGFAGSVVVAMCNNTAVKQRKLLKDLGCRLVWVNCMTFLIGDEPVAFRQGGPAEAYVFQSEFQRDELEKLLIPLGYNHGMGHLIRGAFAFEEVPFAPRPHGAPGTCGSGEDFWIGRLSRPDVDKWSSNHWPILARVPYARRRALAMGWSPQLTAKCGPPPPWAEALEPQRIPVVEFLGRCHALVGLNGGARENWPRVGLEAMAAGVPLVVQDQWGWREMIVDGQTGFLTNGDEEMAYRLAQLAYDEDLRVAIVERARSAVRDLACPQRIGKQWARLLAGLGA
jgi:glycosyltransferase involved in cell wall biosynthesis